MNSRKALSVDSSSLLQLKAELYRKKQESADVTAVASAPAARGRLLLPHTASAGSSSRRDTIVRERGVRRDREESEERELRRSRAILQEKSRLYDELASDRTAGQSSETSKRFLVDFGGKARATTNLTTTPDLDAEQWVHYVDEFGRNRTSLQADVPEKYQHATVAATCEGGGEDVFERQKADWQQRDSENADKSNVHFEDVRFDEARTLGTGYYQFSRDDAERRAQRETLERMRDETHAGQLRAQTVESRRRQAMAARLRKVRERKRLKLGLTIDCDLERQDEVEAGTAPVQEEEEEIPASAEEIAREQQERHADAERRAFVREWDLGKEALLKRAAKEPMTQQEWVTKQREQRHAEFAPPSSYQQQGFVRAHATSRAASTSSCTSVARDVDVDSGGLAGSRWRDGVGATVAPDLSRPPPDWEGGSSSRTEPDLSRPPPVWESGSSSRMAPSRPDRDCGSSSSAPTSRPVWDSVLSSGATSSRPVWNSVSSSHAAPDLRAAVEESYVSSRAGVCVAPPATAEYHCPDTTRRGARTREHRATSGSSDMYDAINAGLSFLRRKQDKSSDRTLDL